jgi:DNA-binding NarL/FixJ family response regulator
MSIVLQPRENPAEPVGVTDLDPSVKSEARISVLIADMYGLVREGLRRILESEPDIVVVGEASDANSLASSIGRLSPDIVIVDSALPGEDVTRTIESIRTAQTGTRFVLLEEKNGQVSASSAFSERADAFVSKRTGAGQDLTAVIRSLRGAHIPARGLRGRDTATPLDTLSRRERQVLKLVASGYTNQEAADRLGVSVKTVEGYRSRVMRKLDAPNRATLVRVALETGLLALTNLD